jgi:hypothetical protein
MPPLARLALAVVRIKRKMRVREGTNRSPDVPDADGIMAASTSDGTIRTE